MKNTLAHIERYSLEVIETASKIRARSFDLHDALQRSGTAVRMHIGESTLRDSASGQLEAGAWAREHYQLLKFTDSNNSAAAVRAMLTAGLKRNGCGQKNCGNSRRGNQQEKGSQE